MADQSCIFDHYDQQREGGKCTAMAVIILQVVNRTSIVGVTTYSKYYFYFLTRYTNVKTFGKPYSAALEGKGGEHPP